MRAARLFFLLIALRTSNAHAQVVSMPWVIVGDVGNPGKVLGSESLGAVNYTFRMSAHETTNEQYTSFLNSVDPMGLNPHGLYNSRMGTDARGGIAFTQAQPAGSKYASRANMARKPVIFVSWFDAARFANWLNNGQGDATTETGSYDLSTSDFDRLGGATIFLPTRDEWIKAGYFDPRPITSGGPTSNYWDYPTMSNSMPSDVIVNGVGQVTNPGPNVANSNESADWNGQNGNLSTVGTAGAVSYYGTYDQAGNVTEWTEGLIPTCCSVPDARGGNWRLHQAYNNIGNLGNHYPEAEDNVTGFRIAMVPEPATLLIFGLGTLVVRKLRR